MTKNGAAPTVAEGDTPATAPVPATETRARAPKTRLPVDENGLMPVEWSIDKAPEAITRHAPFSPWQRLWRMFDQLEIAELDTTVGRQPVKAGFSPWAFVALESEELIRSARASLKGYADTHKEAYLVQIQTTPTGFYVRKMRPEMWGQRAKA
jgi:hypothetical protein